MGNDEEEGCGERNIGCLLNIALGITSKFCREAASASECDNLIKSVADGDITVSEFFDKIESKVSDEGALKSIRSARAELRKEGIK